MRLPVRSQFYMATQGKIMHDCFVPGIMGLKKQREYEWEPGRVMEYTGRIIRGNVVLAEPLPFPDGTLVRVEPVQCPAADGEDTCVSLREMLLALAGQAQGLPADMAENHDHYLYGVPKR